MSKIHLKIYISLLVFWNFLVYLNVNAAPSHMREETDLFKLDKEEISANEDKKQAVDTGTSYKNDEEFHREIQEKLDEHHKSKGALFDRILLVNEIHKRWEKKYREAKRTLKQDTDEVIIDTNLKDNDSYFEGDIILNKTEKDIIDESSEMRKRNAAYNRNWLWRSRQVPYTISYALSDKAKDAINKAIQIIHDKTCIKWITYNPIYHENYVSFEYGSGCYSKIGRATKKGLQTVSIGEGCDWVGIALHEMTHAMGFFHEQSRDDRDKHVEILWENIPIGFQDQFEIYPHGVIDKMGIEYNYNSIMHYSATAFGGGKITIKPIDATKTIGNTIGTYSEIDIEEINALYDCKTSGSKSFFSSWSPWTECDTECYKDRQRFCFHNNKNMCPGSNYYGVQKEKIKCTELECPAPVDGHWSRWSSWGTCSKTCNEGTRQRTRECNNAAPKNGGKLCVGEKTGTGVCLDTRCIVCEDFDYLKCGESARKGECKTNTDTADKCKESCGKCPDKPCQDSVDKCNYWATTGECLIKPSYMFKYCKKSCGICAGCADLIETCRSWASQGECQKNTKYMETNCKASCGLCEGTPAVCEDYDLIKCGESARKGECKTNTDTALKCKESCGKCPDKPCQDSEDKCNYWATTGECLIKPSYMFKYCKKSCGICAGCADLIETCRSWASQGECQRNTKYMETNCKASCGLCEGTPAVCEDYDLIKCGESARKGECKTNTDTALKCKESCGKCPDKPCQDSEDKCNYWATTGECFTKPSYMFKYCKKSCGICTGCADLIETCRSWASKGECQNNTKYMEMNCKASCGFCGDCKDAYNKNDIDCGNWAKAGFCETNAGYMMVQCKATCTGCLELPPRSRLQDYY